MSQPSVDELGDAMSSAIRDLNGEDKAIVGALYRELAQGDPVTSATLAARTGVPEETVVARLEAWPGVFRDPAGHVVGFWGLAIPEMPHRFHAEGGKPIHAWCAIDPFLIVPVIGRTARVESKDPVTGEPVTMTVTPDNVQDLSPPDAVVSFLLPTGELGRDVIQTFCHFVLNFASEASGSHWTARHPGTMLLTVDEAFRVAHRAWRALREAPPPGTSEGPLGGSP